MAIHYENYQRFSKGQGFVGSMCRIGSPMATSKRWMAVDCRDCKNVLRGERAINRDGLVVIIVGIGANGFVGREVVSGETVSVDWPDTDANWAPLDIDAIFEDKS